MELPANTTALIIPQSSGQDHHVSDILKSDVNPLADFRPPQQAPAVENDTLLQADEIKETLIRISQSDPTAKRHGFRFIIAKENKELLEKNGCRVKIIGKGNDAYTEVSWEEVSQHPFVTIALPHGGTVHHARSAPNILGITELASRPPPLTSAIAEQYLLGATLPR
jgi:hypothetical protein